MGTSNSKLILAQILEKRITLMNQIGEPIEANGGGNEGLHLNLPLGARVMFLAMNNLKNHGDPNNHHLPNSLTYHNLMLKILGDVETIERHCLTLRFLWSFDHKSGRYLLNEHTYFSFEILKTKILFYYSQNFLPGAEKFISDLFSVSKSLSLRPKFQLILICIIYMSNAATLYLSPIFRNHCSSSVQNYSQNGQQVYINNIQNNYYQTTGSALSAYQADLIYGIKKQIENHFILVQCLRHLVVHFDMENIFDTLLRVIPKCVEMELFILSDSE